LNSISLSQTLRDVWEGKVERGGGGRREEGWNRGGWKKGGCRSSGGWRRGGGGRGWEIIICTFLIHIYHIVYTSNCSYPQFLIPPIAHTSNCSYLYANVCHDLYLPPWILLK